MSLDAKKLSQSEQLLNKITTELILGGPGKDDGMVPIYALLSEWIDTIQDYEPELAQGCAYAQAVIDPLLDRGEAFDQDTWNYLNDFAKWAQAAVDSLNNGHAVTPFREADWVKQEEDFNSEDNSEKTTSDNHCGVEQIQTLEGNLSKIASELLLAHAGSDEQLVPVYSLLVDLCEQSAGVRIIAEGCNQLKRKLDDLLDHAKPWDSDTLNVANNFTTWGQGVISALQKREDSQVRPFEIPQKTSPETMDPKVELSAHENKEAEIQEEVADQADIIMDINLDNEEKEVLGEFYTESIEHLEQIEAALLVLESDPEDAESLAAIFRSFHTIKGVAGFLHLVPIQHLAHEIEFLLDKARNHELVLNSAMISLILKSQDAIQALVNQVGIALQQGVLPDEIIPVSHLILAARKAQKQELGIEEIESTDTTTLNAVKGKRHEDTGTASRQPLPQAPAAGSRRAAERSSIRVSTAKLDNLLDMVGELVITQSQLEEAGKSVAGETENSPLQRNLGMLRRITRDLQLTSMSLRLVPIKPTFQKVGRLVRDLAESFGKKVQFVVEGEETELDRIVVEQINDPLVHMVRNSLDHGLEATAEERKEAGKSETGLVELRAYHLGSDIVIELKDDGRGIDPRKILKKARERGIVPEGYDPPDTEIVNYIFEPGFSTAEKVTDVSGRGVGMDVVRRNIEALRGKVEVESALGKGTTFKIKLPLTTAIIDGLVVRVGTEKFILPTNAVQVALRPEKRQLSTIQGDIEVLDLRGRTIPLMRLSQLFNIDTEVKEYFKGLVVIIESFGRPYGLLVDELMNKQEVVIKSLGSLMHGVKGVAGGAILGDGTIALILDPGSFGKLSKAHINN